MKLFYRQLLILTCFISLPVSVLYAQQGTNQYIPVSQHQTIESGTYWSAGQMLPHFATPASQLDGIDMKQGKLSSEEKTMLLAVQGIINKRQPRIFLYEHFSEGKHKWPRLLNLSVNELEATQYMRLVSKYKNELKGVILYDPEKSVHYLNLASTVAGLEDAIPVTSQLYELLKQQNIQLPVLADLTPKPRKSTNTCTTSTGKSARTVCSSAFRPNAALYATWQLHQEQLSCGWTHVTGKKIQYYASL